MPQAPRISPQYTLNDTPRNFYPPAPLSQFLLRQNGAQTAQVFDMGDLLGANQHDHEQEQYHDPAGVDGDLQEGDERRLMENMDPAVAKKTTTM